MYTLKCDDYILHNVNADLMVMNCVCKLEVNKTGSLVFYVVPNHPNRDKIKKFISEIRLYQNDEVLFYGRVLNIEIYIDNLMCVECEGELAQLIDSVQRAKKYDFGTIQDNVIQSYLVWLLNNHNAQCPAEKSFLLGDVTVTAPNNKLIAVTNYENTLDIINNQLIKQYGGYLTITRNELGQRFLNYFKEATVASSQTIEFGKNIIDLTQTINGESIYTALIPLGAKEDNSSGEVEKRLTIKSLADSTSGNIVKKDDYIYDSEAVNEWGWVWKVEKYDEITDATDLLNRAKETISKNVYNSMYIELNAIDLHNLNVDINAIRLANRVRCISKPHGIDEWLFVKSMIIDINDPSKTTISLAPYIDGVSPENYTLTGNSDKDSNKIKINDNKLNEDTPSYNDLNSEIDKLKDWTDNNYTPRSEMSDYAKNTDVDGKIDDVKTWTADNYASKTDLSEYAKIADVNAAFNELATAIEGV